MNTKMTKNEIDNIELYNAKKLDQHKTYGAFIMTMTIIMVAVGVVCWMR